MDIAKIFTTGRSQAIRIPKKYRFTGSEVAICRKGNQVILTPISSRDALKAFLEMPCFPDFQIERTDAQKVQNRELF